MPCTEFPSSLSSLAMRRSVASRFFVLDVRLDEYTRLDESSSFSDRWLLGSMQSPFQPRSGLGTFTREGVSFTREGVSFTREGVSFTREGASFTREGVPAQVRVGHLREEVVVHAFHGTAEGLLRALQRLLPLQRGVQLENLHVQAAEACESRFLGGFRAAFTLGVAHRLLLKRSRVNAARNWSDLGLRCGVKSARRKDRGASLDAPCMGVSFPDVSAASTVKSASSLLPSPGRVGVSPCSFSRYLSASSGKPCVCAHARTSSACACVHLGTGTVEGRLARESCSKLAAPCTWPRQEHARAQVALKGLRAEASSSQKGSLVKHIAYLRANRELDEARAQSKWRHYFAPRCHTKAGRQSICARGIPGRWQAPGAQVLVLSALLVRATCQDKCDISWLNHSSTCFRGRTG